MWMYVLFPYILKTQTRYPCVQPPPNQYEMLEYFNVMDITSSDGKELLLDAYRLSRGDESGLNSSRQVLLAFADIAESSQEASFTRDEITSFWNDSSEPLLFATLLNLEDTEHLSQVVQRIRDKYAQDKYLIYFTLDYCEAIIFLKCNTFHHCAELVFSLDYGSEQKKQDGTPKIAAKPALLANSLTLYSLVNGFDFSNSDYQPEERFGVYLRIGMSDAEGMLKFFQKLKKQTLEQSKIQLSENWILGRYDVGIYHPEADLRWIILAKQLLKEASPRQESKNAQPPWYMSHTFSVLIPPVHSPALQGRIVSHNSDNNELNGRMTEEYTRFRAAYRNACHRLDIPPDDVFLRWLHRASAQAVSFWESNVMTDLGICLVSQFLDFFAYAQKLWNTEVKTNSQREQAEACFSTFFSNISILVDGMNHSSRQFILTPPFRTIAFEMPPKVMAYYTAVTHRLIEVFNDNSPNEHYGFIISPKFARELDVRSLVPVDAAGENEFIAIGVGEEWLYQLQHTTAVLAHEISHFVGKKGRERAFRKTCILKAEIQSILLELAVMLRNAVITHYHHIATRLDVKLPEEFPDNNKSLYISKRALEQEAEELLKILCEHNESYQSEESYIYKRELILLLWKVPYYFYDNILLQSRVFDFLWRTLISDECGTTNIGRSVAWTMFFYSGMSSTLPERLNYQAILDGFAKHHIQSMFQTLLRNYADDYAFPPPDRPSRMRQASDLFSEAYADLQAILLFNLSWDKYCELFGHLGTTLPTIVRPRLLAMRMILFSEDTQRTSQEEDEQEQDEFSKKVREIEMLADKLLRLSPDENDKDLHLWYQVLKYANIDPSAFRHLLRYLAQCRRSIEEHFQNCSEKRRSLETIYRDVSDQSSAYKLFNSMMHFIGDYRKDIQNPPKAKTVTG